VNGKPDETARLAEERKRREKLRRSYTNAMKPQDEPNGAVRATKPGRFTTK